MTPTDELRRLLDETGVEWHDDGYATTCTAWSSNGITWYGLWRDGSIELLAHHLTPAQAVAATICDTDATPTRQGDADLAAENAKLRVFASCAYGIASEFMRLNGCPYYDNGMECSLSDECEEKDWAEQPDCLLDALAKALGIEVSE